MFDCVMLAWLLELAAAIAVAAVGVVLWSLSPDTPVVGRPPLWVGWVLIVIGAVIAVLSSGGRAGLEFQLPVRRKSSLIAVHQPQAAAPAAPPLSAPHAMPAPQSVRPLVRSGSGRGFTDAAPQDLMKLANTPDLTKIQVDRLLEPHIGKWLAIEGTVQDVSGSASWAGLTVKDVNGDDKLTAKAYFNKKDGAQAYDRALALHRGARIHVQGKIEEVERWGRITIDPCEFLD